VKRNDGCVEYIGENGEKWDVVTYNSIINGYVWKGMMDEAMNTLEKMQGDGIKPDVIQSSLLSNNWKIKWQLWQ